MKKKLSIGEIDLQEGVIPVTKAAATLSDLIKRARLSHQPIVVTQNGYATGVILDIESFTQMRWLAEQQLELEADDSVKSDQQVD